MSAADRIAKLEALLARVTERATAPRGVHVVAAAPAQAVEPSTPAPVSVDVEMDSDVVTVEVRQVSEAPVSIDVASDEEVQSSERVVAAQNLVEAESERRLSAAPHSVVPETHEEPAAELQQPEPVPPPEAVAPEPLAEPVPEPEPAPEPTPEPAREPEPEPEPVREPEPIPEPPASSRRPIALESNLEELAFGDAVPPEAPHTPPPESGRQIASAPVDLDFDGDFTGVRSRDPGDGDIAVVGTPPPPPPPPAEPEPEAAAAFEPPVEEIIPEPVTSAVVASGPEVTVPILPEAASAVFEGSAPAFKPASFGELLEATLSL
jgi:hypothetical protein